MDEVWDWRVVRRRCRGLEGREGDDFFFFFNLFFPPFVVVLSCYLILTYDGRRSSEMIVGFDLNEQSKLKQSKLKVVIALF